MDRKYELICFDLDGTLISDENNSHIWKNVLESIPGMEKVNAERFRMYVDGTLDYMRWAELDLTDWKNNRITYQDIEREMKGLKLNPGAKELLSELKKKGYKLALISGSISPVIDIAFTNHPFDDIFITELFFDKEGNLMDWNISEYADTGSKILALKKICAREKIPLEKTVFVGDHLNDIGACGIAGMGISYNSKDKKLNEVCKHNIKGNMMQILDLIESD